MKLKHFATYYNKLLTFTRSVGYEVYVKSNEDDWEYSSKTKRIILDDKATETDQIAGFLHELGHLFDDAIHKGKLDRQYNQAIKRHKKKKNITQLQYELIMKCEREAWNKGEIIARLLNIPLGKWYYTDKRKSLKTYYEKYKPVITKTN